MKLNIQSLEKAIASLDEALVEFDRNSNDFMRDACIQRFEYTYELSHKMLKRALEAMSPNPAEIDFLSFQDLIRTGAEMGLLRNGWDSWKQYREARNSTSHTYNETTAIKVFASIAPFLQEARYLFEQLSARNNG